MFDRFVPFNPLEYLVEMLGMEYDLLCVWDVCLPTSRFHRKL